MTYHFTGQYSDILELAIADGLKELLIGNGFTRQGILMIHSIELASILEIEDYVAKIIYNAAKRTQISRREFSRDELYSQITK